MLRSQIFDHPFFLLEDDPLLNFGRTGLGPMNPEVLNRIDFNSEMSPTSGPEASEADASPTSPAAATDQSDPPGVAFPTEAGHALWRIPNDLGQVAEYIRTGDASADDLDVEQLLKDRPDVFAAFYRDFYGPNNDRNSSAWVDRVGGETVQDYARYWYEKYGKWEGYAQTERAAAENISIERLLQDRPDVFRAYFTEYYGPNNDRNSSAWVDRVGGETLHDYAKYWYRTYGKAEGYTQRPMPEYAPSQPDANSGDAPADSDSAESTPLADPAVQTGLPPRTEPCESFIEAEEAAPQFSGTDSPPIAINLPSAEADFIV